MMNILLKVRFVNAEVRILGIVLTMSSRCPYSVIDLLLYCHLFDFNVIFFLKRFFFISRGFGSCFYINDNHHLL